MQAKTGGRRVHVPWSEEAQEHFNKYQLQVHWDRQRNAEVEMSLLKNMIDHADEKELGRCDSHETMEEGSAQKRAETLIFDEETENPEVPDWMIAAQYMGAMVEV